MKYNEFWKYLGDFWHEYYLDKGIPESLWGSWAALAADQQLGLHQANLSKCLHTIPVYWKRFWVPFDTAPARLEFDTIDVWDDEETAVTLADVPQAMTGVLRPVDPDSIVVEDEFGIVVPRDNFLFDFWSGTIAPAPGGIYSAGEQVIVKCRVSRGSAPGDADRAQGIIQLEHAPVLVGSERLYSVTQARWLRKREDYMIHYREGRVHLHSGQSSDLIICLHKSLDLSRAFPYKYPAPSGLHTAPLLHVNTRKSGRVLTLGTDYVIEDNYLRMKSEASVAILWAEEAEFSFDNVYRVFGSRVGYKADNSPDYYRAVFALYYFMQHQPSPKNLAGACQAILGLPVSYVDDKVHDVTYDPASGSTKVLTQKGLTYDLGNRLSSVFIGDDIPVLHPLTDEIKIHDRVNNRGFLDLLFTKPIIHADQEFLADTGLKADSMWSADGFRRMFMKYHTFIVEITNPEIFSDSKKIQQLRFLLQNRAAWTVYVFLFNLLVQDRITRPLGGTGSQLMIDDHRWCSDDLWAQPFNTDGIPAPRPRAVVFDDFRPHDDEESYATVGVTYHYHPTDVVGRFFGIMNISPGELFGPYRYTFVEARNSAGQVMPSATFDAAPAVLTVSDPADLGVSRWVTVACDRVHKLHPDDPPTRVVDRVQVGPGGTSDCFRTTVFLDTLRVFGANQVSGEVRWSASAETEFGHTSYAEPRTYIEQVTRAYRSGADFQVDDETSLISFPSTSVMTSGQRCLVDFKFIGERSNHEVAAAAGAEVTVTINPAYDAGRERVEVEEVIGTHSVEDFLWDGTTSACDALAGEEALRSDYGRPTTQFIGFGFGEAPFGVGAFGGIHNPPMCFQVVPKRDGETLHVDVIGDPPTDEQLDALRLSREQTTEFSDLPDGNYVDSLGAPPYIHRYSLDPGSLFVSRLSSTHGDFAFREHEYLVGRDFLVDGVTQVNETFLIRFKEKPANTTYYLWRYRPVDYPIKTVGFVPLGGAQHVDDDGPAGFPHRYTVAGIDDYFVLSRLTSAEAPGHAYGEFDYRAGTDFQVTGGYVCFADTPAESDYHAWDFVYYHYARRDEKTIAIGIGNPMVLRPLSAPYLYSYALPRPYADIQMISLAGGVPGQVKHSRTYERGKHFVVAWHATGPKMHEGWAEIRFLDDPDPGVFEVWHYFMRSTVIPDGAANADAVIFQDSFTHQPLLRLQNPAEGNRWEIRGYRTDRLEAADDIVISESYVHRLIGPSVPMSLVVTSEPPVP